MVSVGGIRENWQYVIIFSTGVSMDDNTHPEIDTIWNEAKSFIKQGNFDTAIETYKSTGSNGEERIKELHKLFDQGEGGT